MHAILTDAKKKSEESGSKKDCERLVTGEKGGRISTWNTKFPLGKFLAEKWDHLLIDSFSPRDFPPERTKVMFH